MSSERIWILILAATAFLAGGAGGVLFGVRLDPRTAPGPHSVYRERLAREFGLDDERSGRLRQILEAYAEEVEALKERHVHELEPHVVAAGQDCRERIRRFVIPSERRAEFDRLAGGAAPARVLAQ